MKNIWECDVVNVSANKSDIKMINEYAQRNKKPLNLHLGCGQKILNDYINIDLYNESEGRKIVPDLNLDIRKLNDYVEEGTINKILIVHVLEHFNRWETIELLSSFYKCLSPNGILEIEMPDLDGCIDFYINNKGKPYKSPIGELNRGLVQFYGVQWTKNIWETHKYLWRKEEIKYELEKIGFLIIELSNNARYHIKDRDMHVIVRK